MVPQKATGGFQMILGRIASILIIPGIVVLVAFAALCGIPKEDIEKAIWYDDDD